MIETLVRDIEQVVRSGGLLQRGRVLQRLSTLFTERAAELLEHEVGETRVAAAHTHRVLQALVM